MSGTLRLIAGGLLALICCYIGVLVKRRFKAREEVYRSALAYSRALKAELSFKKTPIPQIASRFCGDKKGEFECALLRCVEMMRGGEANFEEYKIKCFKPEESKELTSYLRDFGGATLEEQLALASRLENFAAARAEQCEKDGKRLGNMYFRLLVLLGLAIILILA